MKHIKNNGKRKRKKQQKDSLGLVVFFHRKEKTRKFSHRRIRKMTKNFLILMTRMWELNKKKTKTNYKLQSKSVANTRQNCKKKTN